MTRSIDVGEFVDLAAIDPIFYENTYWLAPDGEQAAEPYRLLLAAMEDEHQVGVGTVVMRNKQHLAAIRPHDGVLALSTMRFADEIVEPPADAPLDDEAKPAAKELKLARQIIESLATDWDPARYHDTYTEELRDLIKRKAEGEEITVEEAAEAPTGGDVLDLTKALEESIAAARGGRKRSDGKRSGGGRGRGSSRSSAKGSRRSV